jgi:hypothetical protein
VATREPGCTTVPSARRIPDARVTGCTKLVFSSIVTGAIPASSFEYSAAHHGVEDGGQNAAVHGAERVVVLLARFGRQRRPGRA